METSYQILTQPSPQERRHRLNNLFVEGPLVSSLTHSADQFPHHFS